MLQFQTVQDQELCGHFKLSASGLWTLDMLGKTPCQCCQASFSAVDIAIITEFRKLGSGTNNGPCKLKLINFV